MSTLFQNKPVIQITHGPPGSYRNICLIGSRFKNYYEKQNYVPIAMPIAL